MITAAPHLNADQLRAVEHAGGPLPVLAGPGTGKTGVLVERISHLVANRGVSPEHILALTFSRRAADEMRPRVIAVLPEAEKVEVRTRHLTYELPEPLVAESAEPLHRTSNRRR